MPTINSSDLRVNQPIESTDGTLSIQIDSAAPLPPGSYRFQLVVGDDSGNNSTPATIVLSIVDNQKPTAILDAPERVNFGEKFTLSGERSIDSGGGTIKKYRWTLIQMP